MTKTAWRRMGFSVLLLPEGRGLAQQGGETAGVSKSRKPRARIFQGRHRANCVSRLEMWRF